jgi:hypothetical protein
VAGQARPQMGRHTPPCSKVQPQVASLDRISQEVQQVKKQGTGSSTAGQHTESPLRLAASRFERQRRVETDILLPCLGSLALHSCSAASKSRPLNMHNTAAVLQKCYSAALAVTAPAERGSACFPASCWCGTPCMMRQKCLPQHVHLAPQLASLQA